jgi:hypothetical protein
MMATMIAFGKNIDRGTLGSLAAFALCAASLNFAATPSIALPNYDGLWSVLIVTEKGDCDRGYRYPIRITRGTLSNAGDTSFTIAGKVGSTGLIRVTVSHGNASANGLGQLTGDTGSGSWAGNSCSGTWTAERRGT